MKNRETILVTGGTGFVGSNLVRKLTHAGYAVVACGLKEFPGSNLGDLKGAIEFFKFNLLERAKLKKILKKINPFLIVHCASNTNPDRNPETLQQAMRENFETTLHLYCSALELKNLKGIIAFGSAGEYEQGPMPFVETQREMPASPYSFSKMCMTSLASYFYRNHNLPVLVVRPSVLYGEYQTNHQLIPLLIRKCLAHEAISMTGGEQAKDFLYVQDLAEAVLKIVQAMKEDGNKNIAGEIINLCTGAKITMKEVARLIKKTTQSRSEIHFGAMEYRNKENMLFYGSNRKAKSLLNWSPQYTFEQGIQNTIRWFKKTPSKKP